MYRVRLENKKVEYREHYGAQGSGMKLLHCTAFYVGGHSTANSDGYSRLDVVRQSVGKSFTLEVSGIVITPSTICARVDLTGDSFTWTLLVCALRCAQLQCTATHTVRVPYFMHNYM